MGQSNFEAEMNRAFRQLAVAIIPSDEHQKKINICASNIVKLLQSKSCFKIGQVCIAGSVGKKTTIFNSDIDCVLFINDEQPPFEDVLDNFEDVLTTTDSYQIRDVRVKKYSIQFKAENFDFDILPAANFMVNCQDDSGEHLSDVQHQKVLDFIKSDPKEFGYLYSGSLAKATVKFMKKQNGFVHEMVRLAKFWYQTLHFDEYVSGAKSLIELVAVYAANKESNYNSVSHLRCFTEFIKYLQKFDTLDIVFEKEYKFPQHEVGENSRPRVMDPVNPYNNLASNWNARSIGLIKNYAAETYNRLQFLARANIIQLDRLFDPQPMFLPMFSEIFPKTRPDSKWLIGVVNFELLPDLKIRNDIFLKDLRLRGGVELLKLHFDCIMHSVTASSDYSAEKVQESIQNSAEKVQESIQNLISTHILNCPNTIWTPAAGNHDDFDITFTVSLPNKKALRISYRL